MEGYADFSMQVWLSDVLVENAKNEADLKEKLKGMELKDMLESGYVKEMQFDDNIDVTITEVEQKINVYNIDWDLSDVASSEKAEEVLKNLPKKLEVKVTYNPSTQDVTDYIDEELELAAEYPVLKYDYEIVETK